MCKDVELCLFKGETKMNEKNIYELTPSQEVSYLQCKYTLFKRVVNILSSVTFDEEIDFDLMKKAFNLVVERNDCLRIKFFKKDKQLMQYFDDPKPLEKIPFYDFKTEEEQFAFIDKYKNKAIKYMKGVVVEPTFIKTFDNKYMVLLKVCHLVLDIYGINIIYKDLIEVYKALKDGKELPSAPGSYEEVMKKDIAKKHNDKLVNGDKEFFEEMLVDNPEPFYAGLHGPNNKIWQKNLSKNHRSMKMFFIQNDTKGYCYSIDGKLVERVFDYCKENSFSPANFLFYTCTLAAAKLNNNTRHVLPLQLCNCRGKTKQQH